jgi:hypothetical protein
VSSIIATQLLGPLNVIGCTSAVAMDDIVDPQSATYSACPAGQIDIGNGNAGFDQGDGATLYTEYCLILLSISIFCCLFFTQFLPKDKDEAQEWKNTPQSNYTIYRGKKNICVYTHVYIL